MSKTLEIRDILPKMQKHFWKMSKEMVLCETLVDRNSLWEVFQNAIPKEDNEIFIARRVWDCNACHHFMNVMGSVVGITKEYEIVSIWDFTPESSQWYPIVTALSDFVHQNASITNVFLSSEKQVGQKCSRRTIPDDGNRSFLTTFHHFYLDIPDGSTCIANRDDIPSIKSEFFSAKNVFKREMEEFTEEALLDVKSLIDENALYRAEDKKDILDEVLRLLREYQTLEREEQKIPFFWYNAVMKSDAIAKFRNTSLGTLVTDLSTGVNIEDAVKAYEEKVAPENYKRSKPIFSERMREDAKKTLIDLGLENSLGRRFATSRDISVNDVLYVHRSEHGKMKGASPLDDIFDDLPPRKPVKSNFPKERIPYVSIQAFLDDVLPNVTSISALVSNESLSNLVSLIAPQVADAKPLTKWKNNFTWAYNGNLTDSSMKENVKAAGGKVDGDLRCSLQWNDDPQYHNKNDFDLHCTEITDSFKYEIYYRNKGCLSYNNGMLDVDITHPEKGTPAVENIIYTNRKRMKEGKYIFSVYDYDYRGGDDGFSVEIEFDGKVYNYFYKGQLLTGRHIDIAEVTLKDGRFSIKHLLTPSVKNSTIWGIETGSFVPVQMIMYSPNYWDGEDGIGNRHYFFMLQDCKNDQTPNGFYNEFLKDDLRDHRKVFEALGAKMKVNPSDEQLSGLGFSSTRDNHVILKVEMSENSKIFEPGKTKLLDVGFGCYGREHDKVSNSCEAMAMDID